MASTSQNGSQNQENFQDFFVKWMEKQNSQLQELVAASKTPNENSKPIIIADSFLSGLVDRVIAHYTDYYQIKSKWAQENVLLILSPQWRSPLENAFFWIGGWRPSTAFQLLYSVSELQLKVNLTELASGVKTEDLGYLSSRQFTSIDTLQRSTIREERKWTEKMAKQQQKVADAELVELSHEVSESIRIQGEYNSRDVEERVNSTLKPKEEGFERILLCADDLRLRTLKSVIEILSPIQGVHFLIGASELLLRVHDWGEAKRREGSL